MLRILTITLIIISYLKGDIVGDINSHLNSKSLIGDQVKHLPYEKSSSMCVSKFICDDKIDYGFVKK